MVDRHRRREITSEYRERKVQHGIIAVRCVATDAVWIASSRNLANQQNGIWFTLRLNSHPNKALQAVWSEHGEAAFSYEVLETVEDDALTPYLLNALLKERAAYWRMHMGAGALTG